MSLRHNAWISLLPYIISIFITVLINKLGQHGGSAEKKHR